METRISLVQMLYIWWKNENLCTVIGQILHLVVLHFLSNFSCVMLFSYILNTLWTKDWAMHQGIQSTDRRRLTLWWELGEDPDQGIRSSFCSSDFSISPPPQSHLFYQKIDQTSILPFKLLPAFSLFSSWRQLAWSTFLASNPHKLAFFFLTNSCNFWASGDFLWGGFLQGWSVFLTMTKNCLPQ